MPYRERQIMTRHRTNPLRDFSPDEEQELIRISHSSSSPAEWVRRATLLLLVQAGQDYLSAARQVGRRNGEGVSALVARFNVEGLAALVPRHGGGPQPTYDAAQRQRILSEVARKPDPKRDGTASWSLNTLKRSLRQAPDGLPDISTATIRQVLLEAGYSWQASRTWCQTGQVERKRKAGIVTVIDPDAEAKKS